MYFMRWILRLLNTLIEMLYVVAKRLFDRKVADGVTNSALSSLCHWKCCLSGFKIFSKYIVCHRAEKRSDPVLLCFLLNGLDEVCGDRFAYESYCSG